MGSSRILDRCLDMLINTLPIELTLTRRPEAILLILLIRSARTLFLKIMVLLRKQKTLEVIAAFKG